MSKMLIQNKNKIFLLGELILFLLAIFFIIISALPSVVSIAVLILVILIPLFIIFPYYSLLFLMLIRNTSDVYTENIFLNFYNISLNFSSILGILIIVWGVYIILKEKINLQKIVLNKSWLFFLIFIFFSIFYSVSKADSIKMFLKILDFYIIYIIAYFYFTKYKNQKDYFVKFLFLSYLIPIFLGIYQIIKKTSFFDPLQIYRIQGAYAHPNIFAFNLFIIFFIFTIIRLTTKNIKLKKILTLTLFIILFLILHTFTRSVWLGTFLFIIIYIFLYKRKKIYKYLYFVLFFIFIIIILFNYTSLKYYNWQDLSFVKRIINSDTSMSSWDWRQNTWKEMSSYVWQSPWLGFGLDTYRFLKEIKTYSVYDSPYAHNDYLKLLIETGIIGLFLYLNLIFQVFKKIFLKFKTNSKKEYLLSLSGIIIIYLFALVDNVLMATSLQWVLWIYIAYLLSVD